MKLITEYNDLKAIADSIREKTSITDEMRISEMPSLIRGIENGVALPQLDNPAVATDILINKQAIDEAGQKIDGLMPTIELATPTITFTSAGTITAKVTQGTSGYLEAGTKTTTDYLDTKEATTYGAKTTDQIIAARQYLVGAQTIKKVEQSGLSAENIVKGKTVTIKSNGSNLWNVTGTAEPSDLNFKIVGGTTQPTNPTENTIWINTSLNITGWTFDNSAPDYLTTGGCWITTGAAGSIKFSSSLKNNIYIYPKVCNQWDGSKFVKKAMSIYINGSWKKPQYVLYDNGNMVDCSGEWINGSNFTKNTNNLYTGTDGWGYTAEKIDLTPYSKIYAEGNFSASYGASSVSIAIFSNKPVQIPDGGWSSSQVVLQHSQSQSSGTYSIQRVIDISSLSGSYYIALGHRGYAGTSWTKIYLE